MLGLGQLRGLWQPDIEPYEDTEDTEDTEMAPLWQRPARVPTDQERAAADADLRQHVEKLRSYYDPDRPRLETYVRTPEPPSAPESPQRGFKLAAGPPDAPGFWLCREYAWQPWSTTEVLRAADGALWHGWGEGGLARPVAGSRLEWLVPALEGVPR